MGPLTLWMELERARPPRGRAWVANAGADAVGLWSLGSQWGDRMLTFRIDGTPIVRTRQVYTANVPGAVSLGPGESLPLPFDLGDRTWEPRPLPSGGGLTAVLEIKPSADTTAFDIWTGRIESDPVDLGEGPP